MRVGVGKRKRKGCGKKKEYNNNGENEDSGVLFYTLKARLTTSGVDLI